MRATKTQDYLLQLHSKLELDIKISYIQDNPEKLFDINEKLWRFIAYINGAKQKSSGMFENNV